ncbi:MAG: DUF4232 domain-containing protein [Actinomycetota bacterium]|nr:DUF4232 domain-containing protein [Actinomycetota bacterium]
MLRTRTFAIAALAVAVQAVLMSAPSAALAAATPKVVSRVGLAASRPARLLRCSEAQLALGGLGLDNTGGTNVATLLVANVSKATCFVEGRPRLSFDDGAGKVVQTSIGHRGSGAAFAAPAPVTLAPGARAGFVFTDLAHNASDLLCRSVARLHVLLPRVAGSLSTPLTFDPAPFEICGLPGGAITVEVSSIVPGVAVMTYASELPACAARGFVVALGAARGAAGTAALTATLVSRNATCVLDGYPSVILSGPSGKTELRLVPGKVVMALPNPALPRPMTVVPGARAQFQLAAGDFRQTANGNAGECPVSTAVRVGFPGGGTLTIHRRLRLCGFGGVGAFTASAP